MYCLLLTAILTRNDNSFWNFRLGQISHTIVGFHMTSLKFKLKNYWSYQDFTFTMH